MVEGAMVMNKPAVSPTHMMALPAFASPTRTCTPVQRNIFGTLLSLTKGGEEHTCSPTVTARSLPFEQWQCHFRLHQQR